MKQQTKAKQSRAQSLWFNCMRLPLKTAYTFISQPSICDISYPSSADADTEKQACAATQYRAWPKARIEVVVLCIVRVRKEYFNSLGPSDAIWRLRFWSTLVQVMSCWLTAPSHYLNQC